MMPTDELVVRQRPRWVDEEPSIQALLDTFIHKLERGNRLTLRVNEKTIPELFNFNNDVRYLWTLISTLNNEYHILSIRYARNKPFQEKYENAQLVFNPEKEELVRDWLNRPALDPYALVWHETLSKLASKFEDNGQALEEQLVRLPDKGPEQTLRAFAKISAELIQPISLRALSARCFWGDSKFLDRREELVRALFPYSSRHLKARPILITVSFPPYTEPHPDVLFVENQDSFLALTHHKDSKLALIYSAGFKGTAQRLRKEGHVQFSYINGNSEAQAQFESWWLKADDDDRASYFWGDLDFAGMAILKALKFNFPNVQAWQPGYQALLKLLVNGEGHDQESSGKERQIDPELTNCEFADETLLPAMREQGDFIDQEAVLVNDLQL